MCSAMRWSRRPSTTTCCRCSAAPCTPPTPGPWSGASPSATTPPAPAAPPPSSRAGSPTTGTPPTTWARRCWPASGPGRRRRRPRPWPRPSGTTSGPWSCGTRRPRRPPAAPWTGSRCCTGPPRRPTWPATTTRRSRSGAWPWTGSTRPPSRCGPGPCWNGWPATTGPRLTPRRRWPSSSGRWPSSRPSRPRRSWPAPWPPSEELARALAAHAQLLMLLGRHAQARARGEEAVAVARQVGARAVEGHALTTLGTCLGILGHTEEGIADLEQGLRIARDLVNVDDLGRGHANLATVLDHAGRSAEAAEVFLGGAEAVRQHGALGRFGANLLPDAAVALLNLGRREEAERLLDRAFDLDLRSPGLRARALTVRATLRLRTGDLAAAEADLRQVLDEAPAPLDPQGAAPVFGGLAEATMWDGRLADARAAAAEGLGLLAAAEEPYWT